MKDSQAIGKTGTARAEEETKAGVDRRTFLSLGALTAAGALTTACSPQAQEAAPTVVTQTAKADSLPYVPGESIEISTGRIRGTRRGDVHAFRGIPYGAPTGGENRFLPARAAESWSGVRDSLDIGPRCPQAQTRQIHEWGVLYRLEASSEDCLVLNVWSKGLNDGGKRPVMVWLHGGAFAADSGGALVYDGSNLADKHDVVYVSINHRLNAFGFLYLPELGGDKYAEASNVGMLDLIQALQWIRDNIERFGGDPGNVTVFGQSGGGSKVSTLMGMPAARGLFHKGIVMSGSQVRSQMPEQATENSLRVLRAMNIGPQDLDRLQQVPFYVLRDTLNTTPGISNFTPVMDGRTLPAHVFDPVASELCRDIPMMIGTTETELTWNPNQNFDELDAAALRHYVSAVLRTDEAQSETIIALYRRNRPTASNLDIYLLIASDASPVLRRGPNLQAERKAQQGGAPVFRYYFNWYSPVRDGQLRSMHCMEIPFVLENTTMADAVLGKGAELPLLADIMSRAWVSFARSGNPSHSGMPEWPAYTSANKETMLLNPEPSVVNDPWGEELRAVNTILNEQG